MANKSDKKPTQGQRHFLLIYRFIANYYRPAAMLLFVLGIILVLPTYVKQLQFNRIFTYQQLGYIGIASLIAGLGLIMLALSIERQSYVRCKRDYILLHIPF